MVVSGDTSFLFSLYGVDSNTPRALDWVRAAQLPVTVSRLNEYELGGALRLAEWRRLLARGEADRCWAHFEADLADGRLRRPVVDMPGIMEELEHLDMRRRSFPASPGWEILHLGAARLLGARLFLTFEDRLKRLALAEGLHVPF